jgi:hypothetical protein
MNITDCTSLRDGDCGCGSFGVPLQAVRLKVEKCRKDGFLFQGGATALLTDCQVKDCGRYGVYAQAATTRVGFQGGTVERNSAGGLCADEGAFVALSNVQSMGHSKVGYRSIGKSSRVQLTGCESYDTIPYKAEKDGTLLAFECIPTRPSIGKASNLLDVLRAEFHSCV